MRRIPRALLTVLLAIAGPMSAAAPTAAATAGPHRILILNSFGRDSAPYGTIASTLRTELAQHSANPIEFLEVSLETVRFESPEEEAVVDYVRALCLRRRFDLVIANGQPAGRFWTRHRDRLLPGTPGLIAAVEERHLPQIAPGLADAAVAVRIDLPALLRHILAVVPETDHLVVILGDSPLERFWRAELRREWRPFEGRLRFTYLNEIPFTTMLDRVSTLPPRSAIFFGLMLMDAAGVPYEQTMALDRLHARASAPIFGWSDDLFGHGLVGGPLLPLDRVGRDAAHAAHRILGGESPTKVTTAVIAAGPPRYDWRELKRWGIASDRLAPGSAILHRPPSILREYRWPILASVVIVVLQTIAITGLLALRQRRRQAEAEAMRLRRELAHAGRVSIVGHLASSLAHELNQPLGAILRNAEAAELLLDASPPDLGEVRAILADIRRDDQRAGGVIDGIRALLRRHHTELSPVDPAAVVDAVAALVRPDAQARRVTLEIEADRDLPPVRGDQAQLKQVLLNLMINGMEAMDGSTGDRRTLAVRTRRRDAGHVEIAVSDTGPGIPAAEIPLIFDNFYTTKSRGMGMGLAISRRIVEAHAGRIQAENGAAGGATLRVTLPIAGGE